jgi:cytochrome c-type biogenesis protein CcmE
MKTTHIVILIAIAGGIIALFSTMGSFTQYNDIRTAKAKAGKYIQLIAAVDTSSINWDPQNNPNYLDFEVTDSTGRAKVVYHDAKPTDMEKSSKIVLKGRMDANGNFDCKDMLLKCPSKYKDETENVQKEIDKLTINN